MLNESVKTTVEALKTNPSTFAMIVMSFGLLAYVFYEGHAFNRQRVEMTRIILEHQRDTQAILAKCVVPDVNPQGPANAAAIGRNREQIDRQREDLNDLRRSLDELFRQYRLIPGDGPP